MSPRSSRRGFTLLEVLLAVALTLSLLGALLGFYKEVADVRAAVGAEADLVGAERTLMDLMTAELRAATPYPQMSLALTGSTGDVRFVTTALPTADAWRVANVTEGPVAPSGMDRQVVGYRLRVSQDDQGKPVIDGIERTCQRMVTLKVVDEEKDVRATLVTASLKFLRLRYWNGTAWADTWGGQDLPAAVEIVMGEQPLPEGGDPTEYPALYDTFRRVVCLPAGVKPATGGTIILGLDEGATP
jgi:prepilin-type N-terminal cleavage/methylation domain-containing protein